MVWSYCLDKPIRPLCLLSVHCRVVCTSALQLPGVGRPLCPWVLPLRNKWAVSMGQGSVSSAPWSVWHWLLFPGVLGSVCVDKGKRHREKWKPLLAEIAGLGQMRGAWGDHDKTN